MGQYAVVENDFVTNVIIVNEDNLPEMKAAFGELVDALPLGLCIGDLRVGQNWTRNLNGEQVILEPLTPQQQTDYTSLVASLEEAQTVVNILLGGGAE